MKNIIKKRSDSNYRIANFFMICTILLNGVLTQAYMHSIGTDLPWKITAVWILSVFAGIVCLFMTYLTKNAKHLSFWCPAIVFVLYVGCSIWINNVEFFYCAFFVMLGIGSAYGDSGGLLKFSVLAHIMVAAMILLNIRFTDTQEEMIVKWLLTMAANVPIVIMVKFSKGKDNQMAKSNSYFSTMLSTTSNGLCIIDEKCRIVYISKNMAYMANLSESKHAIGRPVADLFRNIEMKMSIFDLLYADGYYETITEIRKSDKNGSTDRAADFGVGNYSHCHIRIVSDKMYDDDGKQIGAFIDMSDITPIVDAKDEALRSAQAKSSFLAKMSHEIRTPMNALIGMSELALREQMEPKATEYVVGIKQAGVNLLSIINDILDFSKIESGNMEVVNGEYDLQTLINDVINIIRVRIIDKPLFFAVDVNCDVPAVMTGDVIRIRQVLLNILSNAVKYTEKGSVILNIAAEKVDESETESGYLITMKVTDTGKGIREHDLQKLFGDFAQVDLGANRGIEGTGLGLAIARSLVRAMGGDITVDSIYGDGSTFIITLYQLVS